MTYYHRSPPSSSAWQPTITTARKSRATSDTPSSLSIGLLAAARWWWWVGH